MLAVRAFANLFEHAEGRDLADKEFDKIHSLVKCTSVGSTNKNLIIAAATLYINYAVLCTSERYKDLPSSIDRGLVLVEDLIGILGSTEDSEAVYRSLVAVGTLLGFGEEVQMAATEIYGLGSVLGKVEKRTKEARIQGVVAEIRGLMG